VHDFDFATPDGGHTVARCFEWPGTDNVTWRPTGSNWTLIWTMTQQMADEGAHA